MNLTLVFAVSVVFGDTEFLQETHERRPLGEEPGANDVRAVAVDASGDAWAATRAGVFRLAKGEARWTRPRTPEGCAGPAFDVAAHSTAAAVWIGAWNGVLRARVEALEKVPGLDAPISAICLDGDAVLAAGPDGLWRIEGNSATRRALPGSRDVRALLPSPDSGLWIATILGLYLLRPDGAFTRLQASDGPLSANIRGIAHGSDGSLWSAGLGGIVVHAKDRAPVVITPERGLPSADVRCVARDAAGRMWAGTAAGVARFDGKNWSVLRTRRWLLDDDVRDVAFGPDGSAWVATAAGVSVIRASAMTLAEKADHFLKACEARHVREPGIVEKCRLRVPGDLTTWEPQDDDNDGQYTSMYLAMQSFRFAVTHDPTARIAAERAFHALRFLQTVTGTKGFVARTVIPSTWTRMADPNEQISDAEWAESRVKNSRDKRVANHWRPSADGKWLWKGDTSSDEITGHMFGYLIYHDFAASDAERRVVADHVARIVDSIVEDGFVLNDIDGTHTQWGVWAPEKLNDDPDWSMDRGVNSIELLSYLKLAGHVTGDAKYEATYRRLVREHHYAENARRPKTLNPSWRTHIDDELLALAYPGLFLHKKDPALLAIYREGLEQWHAAVKDDHSPYFDFTYAALSGNTGGLDGALEFLRDAPLDLVRWEVNNTKREDLRIVRAPELEHAQTDRLVPASERCTMRWDDNPWIAVQGDGGRTESDGVFWLLPYWMGKHYGMIE
jgi:hypothetical protein